MVFLPQGLDQTFRKSDGPIFPAPAGLVVRSVLEIPECQRRYRERVSQLLTNVFKVEAITNHIHEVSGRIQAALAKTDPQAAAEHKQRMMAFCRNIQRRVHSIERQLAPSDIESRFDRAGFMPIPDWRAQVDLGNPTLALEQEKGSRALLHIRAEENSASSWRSRLFLDSGQYRLVGKVKTQGVVVGKEDPKAGAGLRVSRHKFSQKLSGDTDWTPVSFDFDVQQDQSDVELVCELRAERGELWVDLKSLKLIRK